MAVKKEAVVVSCSCVNEYQDKQYGKGRRVHTSGRRSGDKVDVTCTVCGNKKTVFMKEEKDKETKNAGKGSKKAKS